MMRLTLRQVHELGIGGGRNTLGSLAGMRKAFALEHVRMCGIEENLLFEDVDVFYRVASARAVIASQIIMSNIMKEYHRCKLLESAQGIVLNHTLLDSLQTSCEEISALCVEKTGVTPKVSFPSDTASWGTIDCVPHLLEFAVKELAKNAIFHSPRPELNVSVTPSSGGVVLTLSNPGWMDIALANEWFKTSSPIQEQGSSYVYSGTHGTLQSGLGVGVPVARCALEVQGASLHFENINNSEVKAKIVFWRRGDIPCV